MVTVHPDSLVTTAEQLAGLYRAPNRRSLAKESDVVTPLYARLIAASPFVLVASHGPEGVDCSPRGDAPGFVRVLDERTLLIPDRRGNNRLDTLLNVLHDPQVGLLFLVPGVGETVRVRGTAVISTDDALRGSAAVSGVLPATVLVVSVERVYFQCQRAIARSRLWDPDSRVERSTLPTAGQLQAEVGAMSTADATAYDEALEEYIAATLYEGPARP